MWAFDQASNPPVFKVQSCSSLSGYAILPTLAARQWSEGKRAGSLFIRYVSLQKQWVSWESQDLRKQSPSTGPRVVIGSPCIVPPGRYDSPCRGKGAGIWRWSRRSWTAADLAGGHIQHALLRRQGRGGSSQTPLPHTGSPAWQQRGFLKVNFKLLLFFN